MTVRARRPLLVAAVIGALAFALAGLWQPQPPDAIDLELRHAAPSAAHLLGTDHLGRDVASRLMVGAGHTLVVLVTVAAVSFGLGMVVGTLAALAGRTVEAALLRLADFTLVVPQLVLAFSITALFGLTPLVAGLALGLGSWGHYAVLAHGLARRTMATEYVGAAEALGVGVPARAIRHVMPASADTVLTYLASDAGRNVVSYAALVFLGLGADPSRPDWGAMLFEYRPFLLDRPWLMAWPALAIFTTALVLHLSIEPPPPGGGGPAAPT